MGCSQIEKNRRKKIRCRKRKKENEKKENAHQETAITIRYFSLNEHVTGTQKYRTFRSEIKTIHH